MKALFIDTETEGLKGGVVEIGYILVDVENDYWPICTGQFLRPGVPWSGTGIPESATRKLSQNLLNTLEEVCLQAIEECDIFIAHNVKFDVKMLLQVFKLPNKPSFCTSGDVDWKKYGSDRKSLEHLCNHFQINRVQGHTALSDVQNVIDLVKMLHPEDFLDICRQRVDSFKRSNPEPKEEAKKSEHEENLITYKLWVNQNVSVLGKLEEYFRKNNQLFEENGRSYVLIKCTKEKMIQLQAVHTVLAPPICSLEVVS